MESSKRSKHNKNYVPYSHITAWIKLTRSMLENCTLKSRKVQQPLMTEMFMKAKAHFQVVLSFLVLLVYHSCCCCLPVYTFQSSLLKSCVCCQSSELPYNKFLYCRVPGNISVLISLCGSLETAFIRKYFPVYIEVTITEKVSMYSYIVLIQSHN